MKEIIKHALGKIGLQDAASIAYRAANPRILYHNLKFRLRGAPDRLPIPPARLRTRVWGEYVDIRLFLAQQGQIQFLLDTLSANGARTDEFEAVLDFGCGAGRAIRQFPFLDRPLKKTKIFGTDINPDQIEWCRRNLPFAEFAVNEPHPPLRYRDATFDFIYNFSVFTHLPESLQMAWMEELKRVTKPGGFLLITTCGESYFETLDSDEQEQFRQGQLVVRHGDKATAPETYNECIAFHPRSYVEAKLAHGFKLLHFVPGTSSWHGPRADLDHYFLKKEM